MKLGLDGLGGLIVSELLSCVVCAVSGKLFHLDVEDAVALWVVEVLNIDGQSKVGALAINTIWLDVETSILCDFLGLEIGWIAVTFEDLKFVVTASIGVYNIISLVNIVIDKISWARN
jgi:hypothetical protein